MGLRAIIPAGRSCKPDNGSQSKGRSGLWNWLGRAFGCVLQPQMLATAHAAQALTQRGGETCKNQTAKPSASGIPACTKHAPGAAQLLAACTPLLRAHTHSPRPVPKQPLCLPRAAQLLAGGQGAQALLAGHNDGGVLGDGGLKRWGFEKRRQCVNWAPSGRATTTEAPLGMEAWAVGEWRLASGGCAVTYNHV